MEGYAPRVRIKRENEEEEEEISNVNANPSKKKKKKRRIEESESEDTEEGESESESEEERAVRRPRTRDIIETRKGSRFSGDNIIVEDVFDNFRSKRASRIQDEFFDQGDPEHIDDRRLDSTISKQVKLFERERKIQEDKLVKFVEAVCTTANRRKEDMIKIKTARGISAPGISGIVEIDPSMRANMDRALMRVVLLGGNSFKGMRDYMPFIKTDDVVVSRLFSDIVAFMFLESDFLSQTRSVLQITGREVKARLEDAVAALKNHCRWDAQKQAFEDISENSGRTYYLNTDRFKYPRTSSGLKRPLL
jgi:hypothetical protein